MRGDAKYASPEGAYLIMITLSREPSTSQFRHRSVHVLFGTQQGPLVWPAYIAPQRHTAHPTQPWAKDEACYSAC